MNIEIKYDDKLVTIIPDGKIDHTTSDEFDAIVEREALNAEEMVLDFDKVSYISSAGLRVILNADELMSNKKGMRLIHVNMAVYEILSITGFVNALNIEKK